jgi:hypothetical protein
VLPVFESLLNTLAGTIGARLVAGRSRRTAARSRSSWRKRACVSREVLLPESSDVAADRVRRALASVGTLRDAAEAGAIEAVTEAGARSSGTVVHVQLVGTGEGTRAEIAAWPGAQLFDWGESRRVVDRVVAALGPVLPVERPMSGRL